MAVFWLGLSDKMKDGLATKDPPDTLDKLISLCNRVDLRFREQATERHYPGKLKPVDPPRPCPLSPSASEPMHKGRARISPKEQESRLSNKFCLYCADSSHLLKSCPKKSGKRSLVADNEDLRLGTAGYSSQKKDSLLPVTLICSDKSFETLALLGSGSADITLFVLI